MKPDKVSLGAQKNFIQFANWAADEWKIMKRFSMMNFIQKSFA